MDFVRSLALTLVAATLVLAPPTSLASQKPRGDAALETELRRLAATLPGTVGIAVHHVGTGRLVTVDADRAFPMASVFKLPVAIAVLRRVQTGGLTLETPITIAPEAYYPGYSPLRDAKNRAEATVTVRDLVETMMVDSDNTAVDVLMARMGGADAVNAELRAAGVPDVSVHRTEGEVMADLDGLGAAPAGGWTYSALVAGEARATAEGKRAGRAKFLADSRDTATPTALANLLARLDRGEVLDAERTKILVGMLDRNKTGGRRFRAGLPAGVRIGDKTGTNPTVGTYNDAALVTLPSGARIALVVMTREAGDTGAAAEQLMASVARTVYAHFARP